MQNLFSVTTCMKLLQKYLPTLITVQDILQYLVFVTSLQLNNYILHTHEKLQFQY